MSEPNIRDVINRFNGDAFNLDNDDISKVEKIYQKIIRTNKIVRDMNILEKNVVVQNIAEFVDLYKRGKITDATDIYKQFADIKHFDLIENFGSEELSESFYQELIDNDISLDELKGLRAKQKFSVTTEEGYDIEIDWDTGISLSVGSITITNPEGEVIFRDGHKVTPESKKDKDEDESEGEYYRTRYGETDKKFDTYYAEHNYHKSIYLGSYFSVISGELEATEWEINTKSGTKTVFRDEKGRFTRRPY